MAEHSHQTSPHSHQTSTDDKDCLFCLIVNGQLPTPLVGSNEHAVAFADINPQAPVHVLVIPREHHRSLAEVAQAQPQVAVALLNLAAELVDEHRWGDYRLVANTGVQAGQSVFHAHLHVLAGRPLQWPPG